MPAIGCEAVVKPVSALYQAGRGYRIYDCFAADRRQASSYTQSFVVRAISSRAKPTASAAINAPTQPSAANPSC